ncbi:cytochrome C, partial [Neisseria gonorrhoeae]
KKNQTDKMPSETGNPASDGIQIKPF